MNKKSQNFRLRQDFMKTISDEDGLFEFTDLEAGTYIITVLKKGYKRVKQAVTVEEREEVDIEIKMKKTGRRGIMKF